LLMKRTETLRHYAEDSAQVKNIDSQIELLRGFFAQNRSAATKSDNKLDKTTLNSRIEKLRSELADAQRRKAKLEEAFKEELKEFKQIADYLEQEDEYRNDIKRNQKRLDDVFKSLPEVVMSKDNPVGGYKPEVLIPPTAALKVEPRAASTMGVAL